MPLIVQIILGLVLVVVLIILAVIIWPLLVAGGVICFLSYLGIKELWIHALVAGIGLFLTFGWMILIGEGRGTSGGGYGTDSSWVETNPLFKTYQIDDAPFSNDKILRDRSGKKVGFLSKPLIGEGELIKDIYGKKVGKLEKSIWNSNVQIVKDSSDRKIGKIETDLWGNRVIKDSEGKTVGRIEKSFLGRTRVVREDC